MNHRGNCWRNVLSSLAAFCILWAGSGRVSAQCVAPPSPVVAWWTADHTVSDLVGGNHGFASPGISYAPGLNGEAFSFDGSSHIAIPASSILSQSFGQGLTVECWIWPSNLPTAQPLLEWNNGSTEGVQFWISEPYFEDQGGPGDLFGNIIDQWGGARALVSAPGLLHGTNFQHVAMTYDGATGLGVLYIDAQPVFVVDLGVFTPQTSYELYLGWRPSPNYPASYTGLLDELTLYGRGLSQQEISAIYAAGASGKCKPFAPPTITQQPASISVPQSQTAVLNVAASGETPLFYQWYKDGNLLIGATNESFQIARVQPSDAGDYTVQVSNRVAVATSTVATLTVMAPPPCAAITTSMVSWWRLGGNARDELSGDTGTLIGGPVYGEGQVGTALALDGSADLVSVGNPSALRLQNLTIEAWVKRFSTMTASFGSGNNGVIFGYGGGGYGLYMEGAGDLVFTKMGVESTWASGATIQDTNWHHVAVSKEGSAVTIFVDGHAYSASPMSGVFTFGTSAAIGARGDNYDNSFYGAIDELSIHSRALTQNEIQVIEAARASGKCAPQVSPVIVSQPANARVASGEDAVFSVGATGNGPMFYQWFFNDNPLAGEQETSLVIQGVTVTNAGAYSVSVSNVYGTVVSSAATLTVLQLGSLLEQDFEPALDSFEWSFLPAGWSVNQYGGAASGTNSLWFGSEGPRVAATRPIDTAAGGSISFFIRLASGSSYPWERADLPAEGVVLEFSTDAGSTWTLVERYDRPEFTNWTQVAFAIPNAAKSTATRFRWRQMSHSGWLSDHWALDGVRIDAQPKLPVIIGQPGSLQVEVGSTASFKVEVTGSDPLYYQWFRSGEPIAGAISHTLSFDPVRSGDSGLYTVVVSNAIGAAISTPAMLAVLDGPARVVVNPQEAPAGLPFTTPVWIEANGNENAMGFTLRFDPQALSFHGLVLGPAVANGALIINTNELGGGRVGIAVSLPAGTTLPRGTNLIGQFQFSAPMATDLTASSLSFDDSLVARQVSDAAGATLRASFAGASLTLKPSEFEGDTAPRAQSDRSLTITDWVLAGRYAAGLDIPTPGIEFQKADCAPRSTFGDGMITVTDWVQTGRYVARLDSLAVAAGPEGPQGKSKSKSVQKLDLGDRVIRISSNHVPPRAECFVDIELQAKGTENALGFSIQFDPSGLTFVRAEPKSQATLNVNTNQCVLGRVAFLLGLPAGQAFTSGNQQIARVYFAAKAEAGGMYGLSFVDQPVRREVSDTLAEPLSSTYQDGVVSVPKNPVLTASVQGGHLVLTWPQWAERFHLQEASMADPLSWVTINAERSSNSEAQSVELPLVSGGRLYRLVKP